MNHDKIGAEQLIFQMIEHDKICEKIINEKDCKDDRYNM